MFFSYATPVMGTHLLGGYLSHKLTGNGQVEVTVNLLTETGSTQGGRGTLGFGDGNFHQGLRNFSVIPLGFDVDLVSFSASHAYARLGRVPFLRCISDVNFLLMGVKTNYNNQFKKIMDKIPCILLVDDDETTNFLNEMLLEEMG